MTDVYTCTPWCTDGDGHHDYFLRADQSCWGEEHVTVLGLEHGAPAIKLTNDPAASDDPHISVFAHQRWYAWPTVKLHLFRETSSEFTSIDTEVHLTPAEAIQLSAALLEVVETIRGRCAMSDNKTVLVVDDASEKFEVACRPFEPEDPSYAGDRHLEVLRDGVSDGGVVLDGPQALRLAALLIGGAK